MLQIRFRNDTYVFFLFGNVYILCEILYPSKEVYSFYYRKNFLRFVQQSFIYIYYGTICENIALFYFGFSDIQEDTIWTRHH